MLKENQTARQLFIKLQGWTCVRKRSLEEAVIDLAKSGISVVEASRLAFMLPANNP
jgi:hypothetical protein